jgi:Zn-dependent peptidase ImmA (M78 family)/transcriptional regulator with XRE-family HTH domain
MIIAGERVKQARELKGWTQAVLAKYVGVSQAAIAQVEAGAFMASDELVAEIASKTHQPLRFFYQDPPPEFPVGSLLFRAHASMSKKDIASTYRHAQEAYELWIKLRLGMSPIPVRIPRLSVDPITAAREARRTFGIPADEPIPHLVNLLEWNGLVALVVPDLKSRDAFSLWFNDLPIMALSSGRSGDRGRMNAAHELGHLILHGGKSRFEVDDSDADDFAAEFLMPEAAMRREINTPVTISGLASLKRRWRVSIQALIVRSKELGMVTDRQYRYLFEQMSTMGWRKAEPVPIVVEQPRALRQLAEMRFGNPIDHAALAHEVAMDVDRVRELLVHYATKDDGNRRAAACKLVSLPRNRG